MVSFQRNKAQTRSSLDIVLRICTQTQPLLALWWKYTSIHTSGHNWPLWILFIPDLVQKYPELPGRSYLTFSIHLWSVLALLKQGSHITHNPQIFRLLKSQELNLKQICAVYVGFLPLSDLKITWSQNRQSGITQAADVVSICKWYKSDQHCIASTPPLLHCYNL